jgi:hypothetical protein
MLHAPNALLKPHFKKAWKNRVDHMFLMATAYSVNPPAHVNAAVHVQPSVPQPKLGQDLS